MEIETSYQEKCLNDFYSLSNGIKKKLTRSLRSLESVATREQT